MGARVMASVSARYSQDCRSALGCSNNQVMAMHKEGKQPFYSSNLPQEILMNRSSEFKRQEKPVKPVYIRVNRPKK